MTSGLEGARQMQPRDPHRATRRWALFLALLVSGGLLLFPRLPLLILMIGLSLLASGMRSARDHRMTGIWFLLALVFAAAVVRPGPLHLESLAVRYANFIGAIVLLNTYLRADANALPRDLFVILRWMALQAVATFILANTMPGLFMQMQIGEATYRTLLLIFNYHELIENTSGWRRPDGLFYEPGVFQLYLNLFLYLALFVFRRKAHAMLALVAVICTQSTTGLLISTLLIGSAFVHYAVSGKGRQKAAALVLAAVLLPGVGVVAYTNLMDKLTGETQGSSWAREYDFFTGLNVISQYPLLGIGFDHARYLEISSISAYVDSQLSEAGMEDRATSNGLMYLYYTLGIPLGSVFLWAMFRQQFFRHKILIGLWLILSLFGEALVFTPFILMIMFSAFVSQRRRRVRSRKPSLEGAAS